MTLSLCGWECKTACNAFPKVSAAYLTSDPAVREVCIDNTEKLPLTNARKLEDKLICLPGDNAYVTVYLAERGWSDNPHFASLTAQDQ